MLELGILGPIEVRVGGDAPAALGGRRQRAVLVVLALHANEVVSVDQLIDDMWGERPPATAVHTVQVFVSRLRSALEEAGDRLITRPPGYLLQLGFDEIDAGQFERLYEGARVALASGHAEEASRMLSEAQALWRGPPLADFTYEPFAQATIARLEELRISASEELIEAQLALGRHEQVVSHLEALIREHPFRERPRGQSMLALYRCGRQAEALEAFQRARQVLVNELAVEPGEALRELEQAILRQDPSLRAPVDSLAPAVKPPLPDRETPLSSRGDDTHGRAAEADTPVIVRKTVTVLATQLAPCGEADPEMGRGSVATARQQIEETVARHGGALVAGVGRDLIWVFGLPLVKEDDALRALRAAGELRTRVTTLSPPEHCELTVRIGVATGEVIAESAIDLFGEPLSRAMALMQAAQDAEILLGDTTRRLAFNGVRVEPALDGAAWRMLGLPSPAPMMLRSNGSMVGREEELGFALATFARARRRDEAHLLTVVGEPGIGKSRFVQELGCRLAGEAQVLAGRCLSYGEGIGFWPLREALTDAAGDESREGIRRLLGATDDADVVADIAAAALGLGPAESVGEQLPWAFRRVLEALSEQGPLLLVIDDVHWGDPPLLDLIDYLVDWLRAPVLLVCLARPELLEMRPAWGGGHARVSSLVLAALDDASALALLKQQLGERQLSPSELSRVLRTAEGNPLFLEQLLQMGAEDPWWDPESEIPGSIQTLLTARLDRLGPGERAFIERAALIGREFWPAAVQDLLPAEAEPSADKHLRSLVHRGLIHPDRSTLAGEEQLRFHHILIRDVAYRSTPKSRRSDLHERFADWLARRGDQYDEFIGYHLEQAVRYRVELGTVEIQTEALAARSGEHLAAAGRRAVRRGDANAGVRLLRSAREMLEAAGRKQPDVLLELAAALGDSGDFREAENVLTAALKQSQDMKNDSLAARALIDLSFNRVLVDPSIPLADMLLVAEKAVETLERGCDHGGIARACHHVAMVHWIQSHAAEMEQVLERAMVHAERAGDWHMQSRILGFLARATVMGARPAAEGIERCVSILGRADDDVGLTAVTETMLGMLEAMRGNIDEARSYAGAARRRLEAVGLRVTVAVLQMYSGWIELMAGSPETALRGVQDAYDLLERVGEAHRRALTAVMLARLLYFHGDHDDCERYLQIGETSASADDAVAQTVLRGTRARWLMARGNPERAEDLANSAVEIVSSTDFLMIHGDALVDRADVLAALGRKEAAVHDLRDAGALFEHKGIASSLAAMRRSYDLALLPHGHNLV